jgi:hypothetical protein
MTSFLVHFFYVYICESLFLSFLYCFHVASLVSILPLVFYVRFFLILLLFILSVFITQFFPPVSLPLFVIIPLSYIPYCLFSLYPQFPFTVLFLSLCSCLQRCFQKASSNFSVWRVAIRWLGIQVWWGRYVVLELQLWVRRVGVTACICGERYVHTDRKYWATDVINLYPANVENRVSSY